MVSKRTINTTSSTAIGKTPPAVYESMGDYLADAKVLEDPTTMPLYAAQASLPRLPVPSLEDTSQRFLPTALPLATIQHETDRLQDAVQKFPHQAYHMQQRLLQRYNDNPHTSWLQLWWNSLGYLQVRDPIVVHVSYFFRCNDDPTLERLLQERMKTTNSNNTSSNMPVYQPCLARTAALLPVAIRYAQSLRTNQTPPATLGGNKGKGQPPITLCSTQCKYMFHVCRIPQPNQDVVRLYFPQQPQVAIAIRGHFFAIDIQKSLSQRQWRHVLQDCIDQTSSTTATTNIPSMGWLTGMQRDDWAHARQVLLQQGGRSMQQALETLESSLFLVCMDIDEEIRTDRDRALQFWHGRSTSCTTSTSSNKDYHNRWYDKSAAILVTQNGKLGFQGEHSMLDGMPFVDFCDTMVNQGSVDKDCLDHGNNSSRDMGLPQATNIFEKAFSSLTPQARSEIDACLAKAQTDLTILVDQYELHAQHYHKYGSNIMKKAGCSPDAYIQMAMQLASYRMFGEPLATYESTQVRRFLHGRTETTRTVSPASLAFCKAMSTNNSHQQTDNDFQIGRAHRYHLLQEACNSHVEYIRNALQGQGVDRHFLGLSMVVQDGEAKPDLFSHPLYEKSKRFRLSTSSLPNMAVGFGPVVEDGFGIGYEAKPTSCIFHVTARKERDWTEKIAIFLGEALDDMRTLCDLDDDTIGPRSRL